MGEEHVSIERIGFEVYKRALKRNLILRPLGNIIYLFLPLCIKRKELQDVLNRTYAVIKSLSLIGTATIFQRKAEERHHTLGKDWKNSRCP